jgi:hypothetical protein
VRVACCGGFVLASLGPLRAPSPAHAQRSVDRARKAAGEFGRRSTLATLHDSSHSALIGFEYRVMLQAMTAVYIALLVAGLFQYALVPRPWLNEADGAGSCGAC